MCRKVDARFKPLRPSCLLRGPRAGATGGRTHEGHRRPSCQCRRRLSTAEGVLDAKRHAFDDSPKDRVLIFDRTPGEDRAVFFRVHRHFLGTIDDRELQLLDTECLELEAHMGPPLALVQLTAPEDVLRDRLGAATDRPAWVADTLSSQLT